MSQAGAAAVARMLERQGETWTYKVWSDGALNAYKRAAQTLSAGTEVKVLRTETSKEKTDIDVLGQQRTLDATLIVVEGDIDVADIEDTTKRSPVFVSPQGLEFEAIALGREGNLMGFHRVFLSKMRASG